MGTAVFMSNVSMIVSEYQLHTSQIFILSRYTVINNIFLQLLFDSPEMKKRNVIIANDLLSHKEFQYTKYRNNFESKNVLLRDQLDIYTIGNRDKLWMKKRDLQNQKKKMGKFNSSSGSFGSPMILFDQKS